MTETWIAFVINQTDTEYTILSERDKKFHTLPLPISFGNIRLPDESVVNIQDIVFAPHQLFMACKGYKYDIERKRKQYEKRSYAKKIADKATTTPNPFT